MRSRDGRTPRARPSLIALAVIGLTALSGCTSAVPPPAPSPTYTPAPKQLVATAAELASGPLETVLPELAQRASADDAVLTIPAGSYPVTATIALPEGTRIRLADGAELTGDLPGMSLVRLAADTEFSGGVLRNSSAESAFDIDLAQDAKAVRITGTTFRGSGTNSVYLAATGISDVVIADSRFEKVVYGVLLNPPAQDAHSITIRNNTFVAPCGDAVEINAVTDGSAQRVRDVDVIGNRMEGACGSGDSAGFGVGLAGVDGFDVRGNTIDGARNEAIHLEDGTTNGTVRGNLIEHGGHGDRPAIAIYRTTSKVVVSGNRIRDFAGQGIAVRWDGLGSARDIVVQRNDLRRISGDGIVVAGDVGTGPFTVEENLLLTIGGNGIAVGGPHERSVVTRNSLRGIAGKPIAEYLRGSGRTAITENAIG